MKVLAGDIGGTNARLAVYDVELTRYKTLVAETLPSREYGSLEEIVANFMRGDTASRASAPASACPGR